MSRYINYRSDFTKEVKNTELTQAQIEKLKSDKEKQMPKIIKK